MLDKLRDAVIASVRLRTSQGDCPTEPAHSVETLESVILDLAPAVDAVPAGEVGEGIKLASDWLRANINNPMIPHWCDAMLDSLGVTNGVADLLAALSHGEGRKNG